MKLLYVMDPVESMHPDKDTTMALLRAARRAGHANLHCLPHELFAERGTVFASAREVVLADSPPHASYGARSDVALGQLDAVLVRKDPPFDPAYLHATLLLERARDDTFIVNDPRGLREANEKLYALAFPQWTPATVVTSDRARVRAFVDEAGGRAVIKPLDGAGGRGVMLLASGDANLPSILELLTGEGNRLVMVQQYLPAVREGDKRVLVLDGEVLGAVLRVPREDDLRANIHVGGSVVASELTARERELVAAIGPKLRADGLYFVGLDLIGELLTEVNVTSPTGIQELGRLTGTRPEDRVIAWLEGAVRGHSR
jgi:glutathione synthase